MVVHRPDRAVFLDRDGVVNQSYVRQGKSYPPANFAEFKILPGVFEGLQALHSAGFRIIVVTNQPDIATGVQTLEILDYFHAYLNQSLPLDDILVCPHVEEDHCDCRKPKAGMLFAARDKYSIDLSRSYLVGDRWRDIEAGQVAGCRQCFFIDYDYAEKRPVEPFVTVSSLLEASEAILEMENNVGTE